MWSPQANRSADLAIVGAGIMGLAHAYAAAKRGLRVVVFDRHCQAMGASVRNFGMIWPIGQPNGDMHRLALRSREVWLEVLKETGLPFRPEGSLHVAYRDDEARVGREFADRAPGLGYECVWLNPGQVLDRTNAVQPEGLLGGLFSPLELTIDPGRTISALKEFLSEQHNVAFRFGCPVIRIDLPRVESSLEIWNVDRAIVCSGEDFETLFPDAYRDAGMTRVKLQMMRTQTQPDGWQLGPALAAGLTLRFYPSFQICESLEALKQRIAAETPEYDRWGIHGLVSQTSMGELTLGDSHEYGLNTEVFDKEEIDLLILRYLRGFLKAPDLAIAQRWHGVYAKHPSSPYLTLEPQPGVKIVTSPGGSGMTLSFGIGEKTLAEL